MVEQETRTCERTNAPRRRTAKSDGQAIIDAALVPRHRQPRTDGRSIDVEIAHCEKLLRDLRCGIVNLREFHARDYDFEKVLLAQAAKIRRVEDKLFNLNQMRLL